MIRVKGKSVRQRFSQIQKPHSEIVFANVRVGRAGHVYVGMYICINVYV